MTSSEMDRAARALDPYRTPTVLHPALTKAYSLFPCWILFRRHRLAFEKRCVEHGTYCGEHVRCVRCGWSLLRDEDRLHISTITAASAAAPKWVTRVEVDGPGVTLKEAAQVFDALACTLDLYDITNYHRKARRDHERHAASVVAEARKELVRLLEEDKKAKARRILEEE